jgi:hypothetical protein
MRQEFICPTYLPPLAENFLRNDFDFGEYLSRCLTSILASLFSFSWLSYILILIGIALWRLVVYYGDAALLVAFVIFPAITVLALLVVNSKLRTVHIGLVPYVTEPDEI